MATIIIKSGSSDNQAEVTSDKALKVDASGSITPIVGTVTADQGAPNTAANGWPIKVTDGTDTAQVTAAGALMVDASGTIQPVSGTVTADQGGVWSVGRTWALSLLSDSVNAAQSGTWNINDISGTISLPTGASTSALQSAGNASLVSIDSKLTAPLSVAQSGSWTTGRTWTLSSGTDSVAAAQSGSWTVTANAGTNLNTSALQLDATGAKLTLAQGSTTSGQTGPLIQAAVTTAAPSYTNAQTSPLSLTTAGALRVDASSSTQPISGTVTANQGGTWNITNISGTVSLPTGASTSSLQGTGNTSLASIDSKLGTLGQKAMSGSAPVVLASDQSAIPVTQSGGWTVTSNQGTSPWVNNISQFGGNNVATGTGVGGVGIPRVTVSSDSSLSLNAGSNIIGKVSIDQTTPGTTNGVQVNAALPTGANSIGQVTANAGTNLNTSALALSATQTNGTQKTQVVDGSGNVQPSGDTVGRAIFNKVTNGTNTLAVTASGEANVLVTPLTNSSVVKSQLQDNAGNAITSSSNGTDRGINTVEVPQTAGRYSVQLLIRQTAATATAATVFSMRNAAASTKNVFIEAIECNVAFDGATPATPSGVGYFIGTFDTATPTGGTALASAKHDSTNGSTNVTDIRFVDTGLTTTGIVNLGTFATYVVPAVKGAVARYKFDIPIELRAGQGLLVGLIVTAIIGQGIYGRITWSER